MENSPENGKRKFRRINNKMKTQRNDLKKGKKNKMAKESGRERKTSVLFAEKSEKDRNIEN